MLKNPFEGFLKEKNWGAVVVTAAFFIVVAIWKVFIEQWAFSRSDNKEQKEEIAALHRFYQAKLDSTNAARDKKEEVIIVNANRRVDKAEAKTDSVVKVQLQEKSELIALFTAKFGSVQSLVQVGQRKTRTLEKKLDQTSNIVSEMKDDATKTESQ